MHTDTSALHPLKSYKIYKLLQNCHLMLSGPAVPICGFRCLKHFFIPLFMVNLRNGPLSPEIRNPLFFWGGAGVESFLIIVIELCSIKDGDVGIFTIIFRQPRGNMI